MGIRVRGMMRVWLDTRLHRSWRNNLSPPFIYRSRYRTCSRDVIRTIDPTLTKLMGSTAHLSLPTYAVVLTEVGISGVFIYRYAHVGPGPSIV